VPRKLLNDNIVLMYALSSGHLKQHRKSITEYHTRITGSQIRIQRKDSSFFSPPDKTFVGAVPPVPWSNQYHVSTKKLWYWQINTN